MIDNIPDHVTSKLVVTMMAPFIIVVTLFVHEFGHYLAARLSGLKVERVVIGFGKCIYTRRDKNGTDWLVRLWPFRAYVGIEDFDAVKENIFRRLFVVIAGPFSSLILPFVVLFPFYVLVGKPVIPNIVTAVDLARPAYAAGLRPGDQIVSVDGEKTPYSSKIVEKCRDTTDRPLLFGVERDGQYIEMPIKPDLVSYRDVRGVEQEHGLIGVYLLQLPLTYDSVKKVGGIEIAGEDDDAKKDMARRLIHERLGGEVTLRMKSADREEHDYLVNLSAEANAKMMDENSDKYCCFYIGALLDNFYYRMSIKEGAREALLDNLDIIRNVAKIPFQLFPINKKWITDSTFVSGQTSVSLMYFYHLIFLVSLFSVLIGLINLIPFPGLDGSVVLLDTVEAARRKKLSSKGKALWICGALILFYAAAIASNAGDMEGYYGFLIDEFTNGDK